MLTAVGLACVLVLGACGNDADGDDSGRGTSTPSTVTLPSLTATRVSDETAVLARYRAFWQALPKASRMEEEAPRQELLKQYLVDPAFTKISGTLASQAAFQKGLYGENVPRPEVVALGSSTASVRDCQDSSRAGVEDLKTGRKITVGVPRNPVNATLQRGADGVWRIGTIEHPGGSC